MKSAVTITESGVSVRLIGENQFECSLIELLDAEYQASVYVEREEVPHYRYGYGDKGKVTAAVLSLARVLKERQP